MKTIKVTAATHRKLKIRARKNDVTMVGYLEVALNSIWDFKDKKISKDLFIDKIMNIKD